ELALDDHADQARAEPEAAAAFGRGTAALLPIQQEGEPLLRTDHGPGQVHAPGRLGQAAVLAGIGDELVHSHAQAEGGVGLEEYVGAAERDAIEEWSKERIEKLMEGGGLPAALGNETMRIGKREHACLVFRDQLTDAPRILRSLREQGQQLREQVAGAVSQLADHQLMALVELPARHRSCHYIGN